MLDSFLSGFRSQSKGKARDRYENAVADAAAGRTVDFAQVSEDAIALNLPDGAEFDRRVAVARRRIETRKELAGMPVRISAARMEKEDAKARIEALQKELNAAMEDAQIADAQLDAAISQEARLVTFMHDTAPESLREKRAEIAGRGSLTQYINVMGELERAKRCNPVLIQPSMRDAFPSYVRDLETQAADLKQKADAEARDLATLETAIFAA